MKSKATASLLALLSVICFGLPGLLGYVGQHYIERAIELNNLNTSLHLELVKYKRQWFSSQFIIKAYVEDEFEEELSLLGEFPATLKHGPVTLVNSQPGFGAFYLYSDSFKEKSLPRAPYISYARAGFFGTVNLNINIDLDQIHAINPVPQSLNYSPLILTVQSDYEFEKIDYQLYWPGLTENTNANNAKLKNIQLAGHFIRKDDERWQGKSSASIQHLSLPSRKLLIDEFVFTVENTINIAESGQLTAIHATGNAQHLKSNWSDWQSPNIDFNIERADLQALGNLYDLAERAYLEFDSPFDEYAQLEYMSTLQTLIPSLLSDNAKLELTSLNFTDASSQTSKQLTGEIQFPDLPEYMDDHLLSLIGSTSGTIEIKQIDSGKTQTIAIKKGRLSIDNQPFSLSVFN